jgi:hypothetical protein
MRRRSNVVRMKGRLSPPDSTPMERTNLPPFFIDAGKLSQ